MFFTTLHHLCASPCGVCGTLWNSWTHILHNNLRNIAKHQQSKRLHISLVVRGKGCSQTPSAPRIRPSSRPSSNIQPHKHETNTAPDEPAKHEASRMTSSTCPRQEDSYPVLSVPSHFTVSILLYMKCYDIIEVELGDLIAASHSKQINDTHRCL